MSKLFSRHGTDNESGFAHALAQATGPHTASAPYLGKLTVVEELVRAFYSEDLLRACAVGEGTTDQETATADSIAAVHRLARIFTGQDEHFTPVAGWNTEPLLKLNLTLADTIRNRISAHVKPEHMTEAYSAATALFSLMLLEYREAMNRWISDDNKQAFVERGEELTEDLTRLLVGLPADDDPD